ncbi:type II secretion system F family protein [Saccharopolyspora sp. CA-218241]|uniref:type II secretion system F family protein n=1 Tax=Saccharopolyspora sp. CA-218241 TaxID=3240027 RepID=UPI003D977669
MLITATICLALALLCWPDLRARDRLAATGSGATGPGRPAVPLLRWAPIPVAAVLGFLLLGPAGAVAALLLGALARRYARSRRGIRRRLELADELTAGLRLLVAQLRAGAHPAVAADGAAQESDPAVGAAFRAMSTAARWGGDVPKALAESGAPAGLTAPLARLSRAWALADRHGVALAELVDAVRRDVDRRAAFRREVEAELAGPRSTAAVLTALPVVGLALGEAVGTAPLAVLGDGLPGQLLLLTGAGLLAAGIAWTTRLTEAVVPP